MHLLQLTAVLLSGGHDIDAGGVDAAVAEEVCQLGDILLNGVEGSGKELAEVMRKYLSRLHPGGLAQAFHLRPDVAAVQRTAASGAEDQAADDANSLCVAQQQLFSLDGSRIIRLLPLALTRTSPCRTTFTVKNRSSEMRIPVPLTVWSSRFSLGRSLQASNKRRYSVLVN